MLAEPLCVRAVLQKALQAADSSKSLGQDLKKEAKQESTLT